MSWMQFVFNLFVSPVIIYSALQALKGALLTIILNVKFSSCRCDVMGMPNREEFNE